MYYTNELLEERISELTKIICKTFEDKNRVRQFIKEDLENGSSLIQELSDNLREIAEKNKEIHFVYKEMKKEIDAIHNVKLEEMQNLIKKKND